MTVADLIARLSKLPPDAEVLREDSEYNGATVRITRVIHHKTASWGTIPNTVELR